MYRFNYVNQKMVKHVLFPFYFQTSLQCRLSWFKVTLSTLNIANMAPAGIAVYDRGISTITVVLLLATLRLITSSG